MPEKLVVADLLRRLKEFDPKPDLEEVKRRFVARIRQLEREIWVEELVVILILSGCIAAWVGLMLIFCRGC